MRLLRDPGGQHALVVRETGAVLAETLHAAFDSQSRRRGLLGRASWPAGYGLVLAPCSSIHTAFMRFPIDAVFVHRDGRVAKVARAVPPWRIRVRLGAFAVIELPAGAAAAVEVGRTVSLG